MAEPVDILYAMPHPDDIEIIAGGSVAAFVKQGYRVALVHLTNGEPTPRGTVETRMSELHAAAEVLGVQHVEVLPLTNRELMDGPETRYALATVIRRLRPKVLVGMWGRTPGASPDHYQGQLIVEAARFYSQLTKWDDRFDNTEPYRVPWLWQRPLMMAAEQPHFQSSFVVDTSDVFEQKLKAIRCYASQFDDERFAGLEQRLRVADGMDGARGGFSYGELFVLSTPVPMRDPIAHFTQIRGDDPPGVPPKIR